MHVPAQFKAPATPADRKTAAQLMAKQRTLMLLDNPFFGSLALRLRVVECDENILMATDGTHLFYNPREVLSIPENTVKTIIAHEVLHCAMIHMFRMGGRDQKRWNIACDHVVNLALEEAAFSFPPEGPWQGLKDPQYVGLSAEEVYHKIQEQHGSDTPSPDGWMPDLKQPPQPGEGEGQDKGQGGQGQSKTQPMSADDWSIAADQSANAAKKAGRLPASLDRLIRESRKPSVDWRMVLRRFIEHTVPSDFSWTNPNRRHAWQGVYLPGMHKENTARLVVAIDTSGSVSGPMLEQMSGELTCIIQECRPESVTVLYCDADIQGEPVVFTPDDGYVELELRGGGGTMFQPVFDWVNENLPEPPAALIYLTDLMSFDTPVEPEYPVLWGATAASRGEGPFGETVKVDVEQ